MKTATQLLYEAFYKTHEKKKRKLYNMTIEDIMKNRIKANKLVKEIEKTSDILDTLTKGE